MYTSDAKNRTTVITCANGITLNFAAQERLLGGLHWNGECQAGFRVSSSLANFNLLG